MLRQKTYSFWAMAFFLLIFILSVYAGADELRCGPGQPYSSIQAAIDDADACDVIIVEPGTYLENIDFLGKAIIVRSTDPCDPCVVAATIIDGGEPNDPNNASVVTFRSGEGNNSILTGFTITGGTGTWLVIAWDLHEPYWNRCGGGVVCYNMSEPTINGNIFRDNIAGQGGGVYVYGNPVDPDEPSNPPIHLAPIIQNNVFRDNSAVVDHGFVPPDTNYPHSDHGDGGAIVGFQGVDAIIVDNEIRNNHADYYGGGLHLRQWSDGLIEDNYILDNDSALGAGVHITYSSSPHITENLIESNVAGGLGGGGIYVYYLSEPLIERNIIRQNESSNGAGIGVFYSSIATIRNNMVVNNISGAGIRISGGSVGIITNNTIVGNTASAPYGGVDCVGDQVSVIENNIIASNGSAHGIYTSTTAPVIRYNNVWDNGGGNYSPVVGDQAGINGNISVKPGFIDEAGGDYHLDYDSDCINAGDPNYAAQAEETDIDGGNRLTGQNIDIGADEARTVWNITSKEQYETIQQAIDEAIDADVIVVTLGVHSGDGNRDIDFGGREITVRSIDPNDPDVVEATVIDCEGSLPDPHRGFYFHSGEDPNSVVSGLTITNGAYAYEGGAIKCTSGSSPTVRNCIFSNNTAKDHGGAIYCGYDSNPIITNCYFISNALTPVGYGGGIYCYISSPTVTNCEFYNNAAVGPGRHGGGICCWGYNGQTSNPLVVNCIFSGNSAGHRGGGLYAYWSSPTFVNCTVVGNQSIEGGGIASFSRDYIPEAVANPVLINCILRDNRSDFGPEAAVMNTSRVWSWVEHSEMTISYCNIKGGQDSVFVDDTCVLHWGPGNTSDDPNFVDPGYWHDNNTPADPCDDYFVPGNYHLMPDSGCIALGDNAAVPGDITTDIDGESRIVDGVIDIGADEFFSTAADIDGNGIVDIADLWILVEDWLAEGDGGNLAIPEQFVDLADLTVLSEWWLWQGPWYRD